MTFDEKYSKKIFKYIEYNTSNNRIKRRLSSFMFDKVRKQTGVMIPPTVVFGKGCYFAHVVGIVIGDSTIFGDNCIIYPSVHIIAKGIGDEQLRNSGERRHAKIGNNVMIGANATIIGNCIIGNNVIISAGAIVTKDVPNDTIVYGINKIKPNPHINKGIYYGLILNRKKMS